jgi:transglutaminase/protease-like cytokinesis protein 3
MWQVGGLSFLLYVGSPQSKESEQRLEKKLDAILHKVEPEKAQEIIQQLQKEYPEKSLVKYLGNKNGEVC